MPADAKVQRERAEPLATALPLRAMTGKNLAEHLAEYEAAARHMADMHRRWEQMVFFEPLQPGVQTWIITREQLDLEEQIPHAWVHYIAKRDAYLAAAGVPPA
jgi:hypothetical protein